VDFSFWQSRGKGIEGGIIKSAGNEWTTFKKYIDKADARNQLIKFDRIS
jgi:hypothetical protein